jgi:hypothetical protein
MEKSIINSGEMIELEKGINIISNLKPKQLTNGKSIKSIYLFEKGLDLIKAELEDLPEIGDTKEFKSGKYEYTEEGWVKLTDI